MENRYYSANKYFKEVFKEKVYKIALDGGMGCPNRDANGNGGCIFCSRGGSGDFAEKYTGNIQQQIDRAIDRVIAKNPTKFIAYFQSYTNTFASISYLENLFYPAINDERIVALSIATRPDCLGDDVLNLLSKLVKIKPVFVELGLQTSNDNTANVINRGYETSVYKQAVSNLKMIGVNVITHIIIGLPGEDIEDVFNTLDVVIKSKSDGVKLQLLHVLEDTKLGDMYRDGIYTPLTEDEYIYIVGECINRLPKDIVVHRITGDPPKRILLAPNWPCNKKEVLNRINKYFEDKDIYQGKYYDR